MNGYNFLGLGTKLDKRLAHGDRINPLDEAAKEHNIWYRDHKKLETKWVAGKVLQENVWNRVRPISKGTDLDERLVGLATTGIICG